MRSLILTLLLLACFQSIFATDYYVSTSGNDASGNGSQGSPWRSLRFAVSKVPANQGHLIRLSAGTFVESGMIAVPLGVSIEGSGMDQTILKSASGFYYNPASPGFATEKFLITMVSSGSSNGNQRIKKLTIDGDGKKLHGGIFIQNRNNTTVESVKVQYVNFSGIWLWSANNAIIRDIQLKDCAWGSAGWCSAALQVANSATVDISNFNIDEGRGYGVKSLGQVENTPMNNVKIHDGRVSVAPAGAWNNGSAPNISMEFWASSFPGTEIYNCYVDNHISLVTYPIAQRTSPLKIYNNTFDILGPRANGSGYCIELSVYDVEIYNNWFNGGSTALVNWGDRQFANWNIHHNTFYGFSSGYPTAIINSYKGGLKDISIHNNTVEMTGKATVNLVEFNYGGQGENISIKNNLIINSNTSYAYYPNKLISLEKGAGVKNLQVHNNLLQNIAVGTVAGSYQNNLTVDPKVNKSGARPAPYYLPASGSPLINAGVSVGLPFTGSAPDIGAYEGAGGPTAPTAVTGVTVTPASVTLNVGATSTLAATVAPANASNKAVTWTSSNTAVATVNASGLVTAIAAGTATLTVKTTDGNKTATAAVTVNSPAKPTVPPITPPAGGPSTTVDLDDAKQGTGINQFNYIGSTWTHGTNASSSYLYETVSYSNSTTDYATLTFVGNKVELYTSKAPHHGIAAVSVDNGPETYVDMYASSRQEFVAVYNSILTQGTHTIKIRVTGTKNSASSGTYVVLDYLKVYSGITTTPVTGVSASPQTLALTVGASQNITATISPAAATNKNVTWTSSNKNVASVSNTGVVTAVAAGSATITVKTEEGAKTSAVTVNVSAVPTTTIVVNPTAVPLNAGATYQLTHTITPAGNVTWTCSNPAVAKVSNTGVVTAIAPGTATVTVTAVVGGKTATSAITVSAAPQMTFDLDDAHQGTGINQFAYGGKNWTHGTNATTAYLYETVSYSNVVNEYATLTFVGSKVEYYTSKASHHGIVAVSVDNGPETLVDLYSATRQNYAMVFSSGNLAEANHTLKIRVTGQKNSASTGTYLILDYAKVYSTSGGAAPLVTTNTLSATVSAAAQEEATLTGQVQIFPNPVKSGDVLHVKLPASTGVVSITDVTGYSYYSQAVTSPDVEIRTSQLPKGMYFLQLQTPQGKATQKIMVD